MAGDSNGSMGRKGLLLNCNVNVQWKSLILDSNAGNGRKGLMFASTRHKTNVTSPGQLTPVYSVRNSFRLRLHLWRRKKIQEKKKAFSAFIPASSLPNKCRFRKTTHHKILFAPKCIKNQTLMGNAIRTHGDACVLWLKKAYLCLLIKHRQSSHFVTRIICNTILKVRHIYSVLFHG